MSSKQEDILEEQQALFESEAKYRQNSSKKDRNLRQYDREYDLLAKEILGEEATKSKLRRCTSFVLYTFLICLIIAVIFWLGNTLFGKYVFHRIFHWIKDFSNSGNLSSYFFLVMLQGVVCITVIPGMTYITICMGLFMDSFWKALAICFFSGYFCSLLCYFLVSGFLGPHIRKRYSDNVLYDVLLEETAKSPWAVSILANLLFIPTGLKNILLALSGMKIRPFAIPKIPFMLFYSSLFLFVGRELDNAGDIMKSKGFAEFKISDWLNFFLGIIMALVTTSLFVLIGILVNRKFENLAQKKKEEELNERFKEKLNGMGMSDSLVDEALEHQKSRKEVVTDLSNL